MDDHLQANSSRSGDSPKGCFFAACLVFGIAALAAAFIVPTILLPAMRQGYENRRGFVCMGNLRAVGNAIGLYRRDFDDTFPPASSWMDRAYPYAKNWELFRCPAVKSGNAEHYGYAMNSRLSMKRLSDLIGQQPSATAMLYDSANVAQRNASDPATSIPRIGRHQDSHGKTNNIVFADGMTKAVPRDPPSPEQPPPAQ